MHILKSLVIAFSVYSKIPVPQFEWKEKDMRYMLCFFPWVGGVIGICLYLWKLLATYLDINLLTYALIGTVIPIVITGGIHVDGYMDTMDAFNSYQSKERKLEILKDSHIGAFSVIMLAVYGLIYIGAFSEISNIELVKIVAAGFFLARCLSGIGVVCFPSAKKEGMVYYFSSNAQKRKATLSLVLQAVICIGVMLSVSLIWGGIIVVSALLVFLYYYYRTKKELGGITGDTAGFFLLLCEGAMIVVAAIINCLI